MGSFLQADKYAGEDINTQRRWRTPDSNFRIVAGQLFDLFATIEQMQGETYHWLTE